MSSKLIGIDFGLAKIGLSISDPSKIISIPLKVVRYKTKNELLKKLNEIAIENDVNAFVIGYPLNMNNKKNEMTELVDQFKADLIEMNFKVYLQLQLYLKFQTPFRFCCSENFVKFFPDL